MAHHFGVEFPEITISPNDERQNQGEVLLKRKARTLQEALLMHLGIRQPKHLRESLVMMTAGIAAVMLIRKRITLSHHKEAWGDMNAAHEVAKKLGYRDIEDRLRLVVEAREEAKSILQSNRVALDALAQTLMKKTTVSGDEARRIIEVCEK